MCDLIWKIGEFTATHGPTTAERDFCVAMEIPWSGKWTRGKIGDCFYRRLRTRHFVIAASLTKRNFAVKEKICRNLAAPVETQKSFLRAVSSRRASAFLCNIRDMISIVIIPRR